MSGVIDPAVKPFVDQQGFECYARESGLAALIEEWQARGIEMLLLRNEQGITPPSGYCEYYDNIFINEKELEHERFSRVSVFSSILLHEMGHVEAKRLGRNARCEKLAWRLGASLCPLPTLPEGWEEIRAKGLQSRGLKWEESDDED